MGDYDTLLTQHLVITTLNTVVAILCYGEHNISLGADDALKGAARGGKC